jgi:hypothetical protein
MDILVSLNFSISQLLIFWFGGGGDHPCGGQATHPGDRREPQKQKALISDKQLGNI